MQGGGVNKRAHESADQGQWDVALEALMAHSLLTPT